MSQNDMTIANQTFPATRADINSALQALASTSKGSADPSTVFSGQHSIRDDVPSASIWCERVYDGTLHVPVALIDSANHRHMPAMRAAPGGRLTLTSATPVTTTDVTAATTVYYALHEHDMVPVYYSAAAAIALQTFTQLSLALDSNSGHTGYHQSGKNFDLFVANDAGTLRLGTGPAWSSDTSRGTGAGTTELARLNGVYGNANTMTLRFGTASGNTISLAANEGTYVGTIRCTADGQTEDSLAKRFVWNAYNRVRRPMIRFDSTDSWNYSTATWRQANAASANQLDFVIGLAGDAVRATVGAAAFNSTSSVRGVATGIGLDSTSAPDANCILGRAAVNNAAPQFPQTHYEGYPGIGRHFLAWLEIGAGSDTQTWYGDNGETIMKNGIAGSVFA